MASLPEADPIRVLAVDDEELTLELYQETLAPDEPSGRGDRQNLEAALFGAATGDRAVQPAFDLTTCSQGGDAIAEVHKALADDRPFAVIFLDMRMPPGPNGVETGKQIRAASSDAYIVIVTAYSDVRPADIARHVPPADRLLCVQKPFSPAQMRELAAELGAKWWSEQSLSA